MFDPDPEQSAPLRPINEGVKVPESLVPTMDGALIPASLLERVLGGTAAGVDCGLSDGEIEAMQQ